MNWIKKRKNRKKETLIKITLIFSSIIFSLFIAELALRIFFRPNIEMEKIPDDILGYKALPGGDWDSNGFRNSQIPNKVDIVALGDSQTLGNNANVSEAWPQILGELSSKAVYQMAVGGYGPAHYYYLLDKAIKFKPRIVLVGFYLGNDLLDIIRLVYSSDYWSWLRNPNYVMQSGNWGPSDIRLMLGSGVEPDSWQLKLLRIRNWLRSHSRLYLFLGRGTRNIREKIGLALSKEEKQEKIKDWTERHPDLGFVYQKEPIATVMSPTYRLDAVNLEKADVVEGLRIAKKLFLAMQKECQEKNIEFVIIIIPTKEMVYLKYMADNKEDIPESFINLIKKESELRNNFYEFCKNKKLKCFDVLPSLSQALIENKKIYGETMDGHPIARGYKVIAEAIFKYLKNNNLVD